MSLDDFFQWFLILGLWGYVIVDVIERRKDK